MKLLRTYLVVTTLLLLSASALSAQAGKVTCKDGSTSNGGRGACSSHGGIKTAATKATAKADVKAAKKATAESKAAKKAETKAAPKADTKVAKADKKATTSASADDHNSAGATAECKDHTYSHAKSHRGACSRHGGVAKFLDGK
jgi:hypothetical protein